MPTYFVRGSQNSFSFEDQVFPVIDGKVTLPDGATWYKDMVGVLLFATPNTIPAEPLPDPARRTGAFFDASDLQPEPEVPVGFAAPVEPTVQAGPEVAAQPAAPEADVSPTPAADAPATRKPRAKRQP